MSLAPRSTDSEHRRRRPLLRLPEAGPTAVEHTASRYRLVGHVAARRA